MNKNVINHPKRNRRDLFYYFISLFLLLPLHPAGTQNLKTNLSLEESLKVRLNNITLDHEISLRGITADFPYPVLTTITVVDMFNNPIVGLADTTHWIGPNDDTQLGFRASSIWRTLREYHLENPDYPDNPDLYQQSHSPLFTEVRETTMLPTNSILIMDASSSMKEEIEDTKAAARLYISLLREIDRAGIIQFAAQIKGIQKLTDNHNLLIAGINQITTSNGTALYDAMMAGIQEIKNENNRNGVIVYTDGMDNASVTTPEAVLDSALAFNLPIYAIALGNQTREDVLRKIAITSGGVFFKAGDASEMKAIFRKISELIKNYYLMAHASPDPAYNDSWRVVDVTVNNSKIQGRGKGQYFVPGPPMLNYTDLVAELSAVTDTTIVLNDKTAGAIFTGDDFQYLISIKNAGLNLSDSVKIRFFVPESVHVLQANLPPQYVDNDLLVWELGGLAQDAEEKILLDVKASQEIPPERTMLTSLVSVITANDTILSNNIAADTVYVLPRVHPPNINFDLALTLQSTFDTTIVYAGSSIRSIFLGNSNQFSLTIKNNGAATARNFSLRFRPPDSVKLANFNQLPDSQSADSLFWYFDSLSVNLEKTISFDATVPQALPFTPFPLVSAGQIIAENDTLPENNSISDTLYAIMYPRPAPENTNLSIRLFSQKDSVFLNDNKSLTEIKPGEEFYYLVELQNHGPNRAANVRIRQQLPDSVQILEHTFPPVFTDSDSIIWFFRNINAGSHFILPLRAQLAEQLPETMEFLFSEVSFTADNDTFNFDNVARDTLKIFFPEVPPPTYYDLELTQEVFTDTTIMLAGDTVKAVLKGDSCRYELKIFNSGPAIARHFGVWNAVPDSVRISNFSIEPANRIFNTYFWNIDSLPAGDSLKISFLARISEFIPEFPFRLLNASELYADEDTNPENNFAATIIYAIGPADEPPPAKIDISVWQTSVTESQVVLEGRTYNFAGAGETYDYKIRVTNLSKHAAYDVQILDILPDSVTVNELELEPVFQNADSVIWYPGIILPESEMTTGFKVTVSAKIPLGTLRMINRVAVSASNEIPENLTNNSAADTVINISRPAMEMPPLIEATPPIVEVGDSILVRVQTQIPILSWDLHVQFVTGEIENTFADDFILTNPLTPNQWVTVRPRFSDTQLLTTAESEKIVFELETTDIFNTVQTARASVQVRSSNDLYLDRNVFVASQEPEMNIHFKLSSNRDVCLDLFDISGSHITKLAEAHYSAGWNEYSWNGITENGQKIGSGLYLITLRSGGYNAWKKVMIVR